MFVNIQNNRLLLRSFQVFLAIIIMTKSFAHGDLHELIESISQEIKKHPDSAELFLTRANYYRLHKEFEKSHQDIDSAIALKPTIETRLVRSLIYIDCDNYLLADSCINSLIEDIGFNTKAYHVKTIILKQQKKYNEALSFQKKILYNSFHLTPDDYYEAYKLYEFVYPEWPDSVFLMLNDGREKMGDIPFFDDLEFNISIETSAYEKAHKIADKNIKKTERKEFWYAKKAKVYQLTEDFKNEKRYLHLVLLSIDELPSNHKATEAISKLKIETENRLKHINE